MKKILTEEEPNLKDDQKNEATQTEKQNVIISAITSNFDMFNFIFDLLKNEGVGSIYTGLSSSIIGSIVQHGIYFCSNRFWKIVLDLDKSVVNTMIINFLSAMITTFVTNPIWVINTRMANLKKNVNIS